MAFNTPLTQTSEFVFGRGVCYFAPFDENGVPMGERDLGEVNALALSVTSEKLEKFSHRSGIAKKILSITTSVTFNASLTFEDFSAENTALFLSGTTGTVEQGSTPVTNERIYNAQGGREYQLGTTAGNPTGVRGVSSVTIGLYELVNAATRVNATAYAVGDVYKSSTNVFIVTVAGTSAGSAPSFVTANVGDSTVDGGATVEFIGTTSNYTVTTHYVLSPESARFGIKPTGALADACALYYEVTGGYPSINAGYTPAANSRTQISSESVGAVNGQFRFIAENGAGDNRDLFIASCSLAPNGDLPFITDNDTAAATLDLGINERDSDTPQIIIDGRPV